MGLMPIIFTMLTIFAISIAVIFVVSYILFRLKRNVNKPAVIRSERPVNMNYEYRVRDFISNVPEPQPVRIQYRQPVLQNNQRRFEVLNFQRPENTVTTAINRPYYFPSKNGFNIYEHYSEVI